ncbi:rod shape-determining protein MreD [Pustulibacterium marinum]|nr:rod shape-determining protein MreD [Pustulibacterium marinum]
MNNPIIINSIRFILLVLLQVLLLNHINLFGNLNPLLYILFIIWYPTDNNRILFIFLSFLIGLSIDSFTDSGGVHAAASVFLAYIRPYVLKLSFGSSIEKQSLKLGQTPYPQRFIYLLILILTHHLILFSLEIFSFAHILLLLQKTFYTSIFTFILCVLSISLFRRK